MMRVFHFCSTTVDTAYFKNLCTGLSGKGISILCGSLRPASLPSWLRGATTVRYFGLNAGSRFEYAPAIFRLAKLLRRERVDILQTHLFDAGIVGVLAARLAGIPVVVVTRHHSDLVRLTGTQFHVALDRWMARQADGLIAVSHAVRDYMIAGDRLNGERIETIHYGFDFQSLAATEHDRRRVRAEFGFDSDFVIGCVGHFFKSKGHLYLLSALKELVSEIPKARLLLVGDSDRTAIQSLIHGLRLEDRVIFAGYRKDIAACMGAMDLVVHPSLSEAFCQVIIEAMAVGTPLVATTVGGATEVVTHGETGMLVPPADPAAIAHAVLELYRNPDLRERIAIAGQKSVRERFTVERMVNKQIACYERWLSPSIKGNYVRSQV